MFRIRLLAATGLCLALFLSLGAAETEARGWSSSARYNSSYFHDYHNYGALYSHRPHSYYNGHYGVRTYPGLSRTSYYGGWSYYAPSAYTPRYSYYQRTPAVSYSSYYRSYPVATQYVGYRPRVYTSNVSACQYGPTCCGSTVAYTPGCFSNRPRCGLLGPFCPFRRARQCNYGTCGSFGYSGGRW